MDDQRVDYLTEDCVLVVQVRLRRVGEEELAPVGIGSVISHRHDPSLV
jgi:hypothetical protein